MENKEQITNSVAKDTTKKVVKTVAPKKVTIKKTANKKVAKKAVVKKAIKKSAKRKAPAKKAASKKVIRQEQYFFLKDGTVIKSIEQLAKIMDGMHDDTFYHHVNDERHDFANWINDIFEEAELANQLMEAERQKEKNHYIVLKFIVKQ